MTLPPDRGERGDVTYYRWRQEFGGLKTEQVERLKDLELENSRLRKAVSDLDHSAGTDQHVPPPPAARCGIRHWNSAHRYRRSVLTVGSSLKVSIPNVRTPQ